MELHTINGVLHAMPDTVRAHHAVDEWLKDPDGTVARLAVLDKGKEQTFRAERIKAREAHEKARQDQARVAVVVADPALVAQRRAEAEAIERMHNAAAGKVAAPKSAKKEG